MKYEFGKQIVPAVYDDHGTRNPLIEALPDSLDMSEFNAAIQNLPPIPMEQDVGTVTARRRGMATLHSIFIPISYMYRIYDQLFRLMQAGYYTETSRKMAQRINSIFATGHSGYGELPEYAAFLGTAGIGKTTMIKRCLRLMPQVIAHEKYYGNPFYTKQVLWLFVECPSDASSKTMALNIVRALDSAVGSHHVDQFMKVRASATSSLISYVKTLCITYHVGLLVVDEIQNVVVTAAKKKTLKPLVKLLTELTNETCASMFFVGTHLAEEVFIQEEHLRRRTRGFRLTPFTAGGEYRSFLQTLWRYQYMPVQTELTERIANRIYDLSGGIPAYIMKLFEETQANALVQGIDRIDERLITETAALLSIEPPKVYDKGESISDSKAGTRNIEWGEELPTNMPKRGRKAKRRDKADLICAFKEEGAETMMLQYGMLEEVVKC